MNFSTVSMLRPICKIPLFLLLLPHTIRAMEEGNTSAHDQQRIFTNPLLIKAMAKFHTHDQRAKDFARYIAPPKLVS